MAQGEQLHFEHIGGVFVMAFLCLIGALVLYALSSACNVCRSARAGESGAKQQAKTRDQPEPEPEPEPEPDRSSGTPPKARRSSTPRAQKADLAGSSNLDLVGRCVRVSPHVITSWVDALCARRFERGVAGV